MSTALLSVALLGLGGLVGHLLTRRRSNGRNAATRTGELPPTPHRIPLIALVVIGTIAVTLLGIALFGWLAWLLSRHPAPWHDPNGWRAFIFQVDGTKIFDAARITATLLAIIGIGGAALVAYRRQDTAEQSHQVAIQAHMLDSNKYELDRQRHQLETDGRTDDRERELRSRFTTIAGQLGSDIYAIRHAGAYALASLADDWHRFGNDGEHQVCVNLLCAQLRSPRQQRESVENVGVPTVMSNLPEDIEVRKTIVALIRSHRPIAGDDHTSWKSCSLDLSGADLSGFNLEEIDLSSANLDDADLSRALVVRADLTDAMMTRVKVTAAEFTGSTMTRARLYSARAEGKINGKKQAAPEFGNCDLREAFFVSASLPDVQFPESDLTGAHFGSAKIAGANFREAKLANATLWIRLERVSFRDADLRGALFSRRGSGRTIARAEFIDADFRGALYDETTKWPHNVLPGGLQQEG